MTGWGSLIRWALKATPSLSNILKSFFKKDSKRKKKIVYLTCVSDGGKNLSTFMTEKKTTMIIPCVFLVKPFAKNISFYFCRKQEDGQRYDTLNWFCQQQC